MCSILSAFTSGRFSPEQVAELSALLERTKARGPDENGVEVVDGQAFLGSNRLRIIDMTEAGRMPLKADGRDCWITFNGEIYNHRDLREELRARGFTFRSATDTEVALNAYLAFGEAFVERLNGIFAIVIYDHVRRKVVTARDRFGAKPLYWLERGEQVVFSSDFLVLRALLPDRRGTLDRGALTALMACRFVPGAATIVQEIRKTLPAETQVWSLDGLALRSRIFWRPKLRPATFRQDEFEARFATAVRRTFEADATPSILLSGGLDSSAMVAALHAQGRLDLRAYSCAFGGDQVTAAGAVGGITTGNVDEGAYARAVAGRFGLRHEELAIDANLGEGAFSSMQRALGEPIASTNALGLFLFGRALAGRTRLAVAGTGADELLGGYEQLYFPGNRGGLAARPAAELLARLADFDYGKVDPVRLLVPELRDVAYLLTYTSEVMRFFDADAYPNELLNQLLVFELSFALPGWELDQADRLFMDQSIELRPGFLENEFVDYCLTIPSAAKRDKRPLREAMRGRLPTDVVDRPKLPSLGTPLEVTSQPWFRAIVAEALASPADWFDARAVRRLLSRPVTQASFDVLYRVVYLQRWFSALW